jgi:NDP-sugar pyrophosphorylase family protein
MSGEIKTAFVLGAGLGTRLRPLTEKRPKPLVPIFNKPLITFAFDHLIAAGIRRFVVNTHHHPEAYSWLLGESGGRCVYRDCPVFFCHEPVLLETGGGIKNASKLIGDEPFVVYNGDVLADIPIANLITAHANGNRMATLALRSVGAERRIQCDLEKGVVTDMRGLLGGRMDPSFLFTGISVFSPEIFDHIPKGEIISIIPVLAEILSAGNEIGGVLIDEGAWFDIGNVDAYIEAHAILASQKHTISYLPDDWIVPIDSTAIVKSAARFSGFTSIGAGATIGEDAHLHDVIVWPGASVDAGVHLQKSVVI